MTVTTYEAALAGFNETQTNIEQVHTKMEGLNAAKAELEAGRKDLLRQQATYGANPENTAALATIRNQLLMAADDLEAAEIAKADLAEAELQAARALKEAAGALEAAQRNAAAAQLEQARSHLAGLIAPRLAQIMGLTKTLHHGSVLAYRTPKDELVDLPGLRDVKPDFSKIAAPPQLPMRVKDVLKKAAKNSEKVETKTRLAAEPWGYTVKNPSERELQALECQRAERQPRDLAAINRGPDYDGMTIYRN